MIVRVGAHSRTNVAASEDAAGQTSAHDGSACISPRVSYHCHKISVFGGLISFVNLKVGSDISFSICCPALSSLFPLMLLFKTFPVTIIEQGTSHIGGNCKLSPAFNGNADSQC